MVLFKDIVSRVSSMFIEEALQSPHLLSDMAKMEYYMAESYGGRVLIELLQNSDDANSTKTIVYIKGNDIYFANNGRPFDENDLVAISRSGASGKERGQTIGYRGIGFKSTSYISNDIIIYSNNAYFTFSKSVCAHVLKVRENDVPTIRIPIAVESPHQEITQTVGELLQCGYTTVFVFKNANIQALSDEINSIGVGHFLFLNNINECIIQDNLATKNCFKLYRCQNNVNNHIIYEANNDKQEWIIYQKNKVSVAFLSKDGVIVPCLESDAVYHCFLPTIDKFIIKCKVNADFSTDPSRKHITIDDKTKSLLSIVADILFEVLKNAVNTANSQVFKNICTLFTNKNLISKTNQLVDDFLENNILNQKWLTLNNGCPISPRDYKRFPSTFDIDSSLLLRKISGKLKDESLPINTYETIDNIDDFVCQYSQKEFEINDFIFQLESEHFVGHLNSETHTQLLTNILREVKIKSCLSPNFNYSIENILVRTDNQGIQPLHNLADSKCNLDANLKKELSERLGASEVTWLQEKLGFPVITTNSSKISTDMFNYEDKSENNTINSVTPHISRWRDAESKCIEIEEVLGNTATDVSFRNLGYDILSETPDGKTRYIEVKSVKKDYSFSLTNNEYTAAHQYGKDYYVCLLYENERTLDVRYIQDPLNTARFEKRIKQWEWACVEFNATLKTFELD